MNGRYCPELDAEVAERAFGLWVAAAGPPRSVADPQAGREGARIAGGGPWRAGWRAAVPAHRQSGDDRVHRPQLYARRRGPILFPERSAARVRDAGVHAMDLPARCLGAALGGA